MSKSKNHTAHNQTKKAHKNGIKKPKTYRKRSMKYVDAKFSMNQKFVTKGNLKAVAAAAGN